MTPIATSKEEHPWLLAADRPGETVQERFDRLYYQATRSVEMATHYLEQHGIPLPAASQDHAGQAPAESNQTLGDFA